MDKQIRKILTEAEEKFAMAVDAKLLEKLYIEYFGKKSPLNILTAKIPKLDPVLRPKAGQQINKAKKILQKMYEGQKKSVHNDQSVSASPIDVSAPGHKKQVGSVHLVSQAIEEIAGIFTKLGYSLQSYPEIDWDWYVFESLNMPAEHPARDDWETFFVKSPKKDKLGNQVLTPHTSNGQVREMERSEKPPIRMMNLARCYRRQIDVSHTPMFHQFEGMLIDKNVSIPDLKGTFDYFTTSFFGPNRVTRLRPHHFRFTEPSFEVDVTCDICDGNGCRMCKSGWLELGGAGMIHPSVLKAGNIDPDKYSGFAFGWGIERTISMKTKIPDIRLLYQNDYRFLKQF